ncbi:MAG: replicative DNA helicase [candidate division KSB1 bacterium]|nr:replicative DNA helicase [candidate division KSB1 bacterium]
MSVRPERLVIEKAILSVCLAHPAEATDQGVWEVIQPDHFTQPNHRLIFRAMQHLWQTGRAIDPVTVHQVLERKKVSYGGLDYLAELLAGVPTPTGLADYVDFLRLYALEDQLGAAAQRIVELVSQRSLGREELVSQAEAELRRATEQDRQNPPERLAVAASRVLDLVTKRAQSPKHLVGLPTGLAKLNELTGGWREGQYIVVGARPSTGKTALAWFWAQEAAASGFPALFVSLEMTSEELIERLLARVSRIDSRKLQTGMLGGAELERLKEAVSLAHAWPLWIADEPMLRLSPLRSRVHRAVRDHGIRLLVIDYLQLLRPDREQENEVQNLRAVSAGLKALAKDLKLSLIVCSQLSRLPEQRADQKPRLSDLRESGAIEQDADVVVLLWAKESNPTVLELIVAKHRNGPKGQISVYYDRATGYFGNLVRSGDVE